MKRFIIAVVLIAQYSFGQSSVDKVLKVEYDEYRIYTAGFINLDLGTLIVSNEFSYYNSVVKDKITNNYVPNERAIMFKSGKGNAEILPEIIIDRKKNLLTERLYEDLYLKDYYAVQESLPKMKWKLSNEKKVIGKYDCQKASVEFRGRTYDAWYTSQIPISLGPWKFNGLPGLILEVEDRKAIYKWNAKAVSYNSNVSKKEISLKIQNDSKFEKISFKDFDAKKVKKVQDLNQTVKSRNGNRGNQFGFTTTFEFNKEPLNEFRNRMIID